MLVEGNIQDGEEAVYIEHMFSIGKIIAFFFLFNGIKTFVDYLMLKLFL